MERDNTDGREENAALPLGERPNVRDKETKRVGREETTTAGPDGPDSDAVGDLFKKGVG